MMYPLVLDLAAKTAPVRVPVAVTCRVLGFSKQAFYQWRKAPVTQRDWDDAALINAALDVHRDDPEFGYRLITDELRDLGHSASENRVGRLCTAQRIYSVFAKKKGLRGKPGPAVHDDLVKRKFTAQAPDTLWLTDIIEHRTDEGKLYLCAIKDVWSNRIVGYSIDSNMRATLAVRALHSAIGARPHEGCVLHSDRGSRVPVEKVRPDLDQQRPARVDGLGGACADNAAMESFFALLQKNVLDRQRWRTRAELRLAIVTWIERTYHRKRRQRRLGTLTPIEFETINRTAAAA
jgi:putative transposase